MISFSSFVSSCLNEEYSHIPMTQLGTNPGGKYINRDTGDIHYIKFPKNPTQARVEVATANIYNKLGLETLNPKLVNVDGKLGVATKWDDSLKPLYHDLDVVHRHPDSMALMHHAAALTNNWDIVGDGIDNILTSHDGSRLVSADQGGSMNFRAQGEPKPFSGDDISSRESLLDPRFHAGRVFEKAYSTTSQQTKERAVAKIRSLDDASIDDIIHSAGLGHEYADTIKRRRDLF